MTSRPTPKFTGVDTFRDPKGRYSIRFPSDWTQYTLANRQEGVQFSPQASNPQTWLAVWITDLKEHVVAEDLPVLRQGVDKGIADLPDSQVEQATEEVLSNLIKFERVFTFRQGEVTRKWRQWQLYVDRWLIVVTYQGENPEEYDHWYAMSNYCFLHFVLPEALWFAVDRDLAGINRPAADDAADEGEE